MRKLLILGLCSILFSTDIAYSQTIPYTINEVTIVPNYIGGQIKLNEFVAANFVSPENEGVTGTIKIKFIIETNGTLTNIKIVQSLGDDYTQAAKNVFLKSPKWLPGEFNGEKVRVIMNYPIIIQ